MNQPQAIEYQTTHKTVILSNKKQLVVRQGYPCIDGGKVKHNGKLVDLMIRYDNKPELAAKITGWLEAWDEYNAWMAKQVEAAKSTIKTNSPVNFDQAENDDLSWTYWDGTSGKTLTEKSSGREIYQMRYTGTGEVVEGEMKVKVMAFWRALEELKNEPPKTSMTTEEVNAFEKVAERLPVENNHPGWCNHCHSYCYGDCQS